MMYKANVAVFSDIRTKHPTQSERQVEFLNVKPGGTWRNRLGFKRLNPFRCKLHCWMWCTKHAIRSYSSQELVELRRLRTGKLFSNFFHSSFQTQDSTVHQHKHLAM